MGSLFVRVKEIMCLGFRDRKKLDLVGIMMLKEKQCPGTRSTVKRQKENKIHTNKHNSRNNNRSLNKNKKIRKN